MNATKANSKKGQHILEPGDLVRLCSTPLSRYMLNYSLNVINYDILPAQIPDNAIALFLGTIKTDPYNSRWYRILYDGKVFVVDPGSCERLYNVK